MTGVDTIGGYYTPYENQYKQQENKIPQATVVQPLTTDTFVRENGGTANSVNANKIPTVQRTKKSNTLGKALIWFLGIGAVASGIAMHKGGGIKNAFKNKEVISTTKNGFSKIWNNITGNAGKTEQTVITKKTDVIQEKLPKKFTVTQNGTMRTCEIPGKYNISNDLKGRGTVAQQAQKIGVKTTYYTVPDNAKVKKYTFTYKNFFGLNKYKVTVKNGKLESITNSKNNPVTLGENALAKINQSIENISNGKTQDILDYTVQSYKINENGVAAQFKRQGNCFKISSFISDKFALDSDEAIAYAVQNPEAKTLIDAVKSGRNGLNLLSGEVNCRLGTVKVENGEIAGIIQNKIYYPNTDAHFIALQEKNKQLFQDILNNKYRYKSSTYGV